MKGQEGSPGVGSAHLDTDAAGVLDGVLVADFSRVLAGPYMTMLLGDLGATIVKVESPEGDSTREWGPPWIDGESTYYKSLNRNKHSIVLDLKDPDDRELAEELGRRSDILVENLMPRRMRSFGLDYASLAAQNPRLIYCSISGFGSQEKGASLPGYDLIAQAVGGLMSITGEEDGPPLKVGVAVVDVLCGLCGCLGVMAALSARDRLGHGQLVEVNLLSSVLAALTNQSAGYLLTGNVPNRLGNAHPSVAPYETFKVKDGNIVLAAGSDTHYVNLCKVLEVPELATDDRFATNADRVAHRVELRSAIEPSLRAKTRAEVIGQMQAAGVPCGPVNSIAEAFEFAEKIGLETTWTIDGERYVRSPIFLSDTPMRPTKAPPELGASDGEVRDWLRSPLTDRDVHRKS